MTAAGDIIEMPVTTFPLLRIPIHMTYLVYLLRFSRRLAWSYFSAALRVCRITKTSPSLLLHPLDFLGADDDAQMAFFPGMNIDSATKQSFVDDVLRKFQRCYNVQPLSVQTATMFPSIYARHRTPTKTETLPHSVPELVAK
jgi:hypothetical protein